MSPSLLLSAAAALALSTGSADGFAATSPVSRSAFTSSTGTIAVPLSGGASIVMDTEGDSIDHLTRDKISQTLFGVSKITPLASPPLAFELEVPPQTIEEAEHSHGMPWEESIDETTPLLYMPFWEWQMGFMKKELTNLRVVECDEEFSYNENLDKKARIVNVCFRSDEYRKIRMTYYDAGESCQVFNSVFYPDAKYNLPVLGVDVLAFNRKKHLAIVDFQPLHDEEGEHALEYEHVLSPIKDEYDSLKGRMSSKFYDETKFFSQQMLFARFEDEAVVQNELEPAFQRYVKEHVELIRKCDRDGLSDETMKGKLAVLKRQAAYDTYSAERDPATAFFAAMFGKKWADDFVHDFLFSMSDRSEQQSKVPKQQRQHSPQMGCAPPRVATQQKRPMQVPVTLEQP